MAGETERAVIALVRSVLNAELSEMPPWLVRPGRAECGAAWPLIQTIYSDLTSGLELPEAMRAVERRQVDAVLLQSGQPPRILEVDERQHFNQYRAQTLAHYARDIQLAFPADVWIARSRAKSRLEEGGFATPRPPLFPGDGGRHRQRAFRDALCDILPLEHGFLPTLRIADFEVVAWLDAHDARLRMRALLEERAAL